MKASSNFQSPVTATLAPRDPMPQRLGGAPQNARRKAISPGTILDNLLFVRGRSEMARYRAWCRRIAWADFMARGGLSLAVRAFLKNPARQAREAVDGVRSHGRLGEEAGVGVPRQLLRLWWYGLRHGTIPDTFYRYQLYAGRPARHPGRLVQRPEAARIYRSLAAGPFRAVAEMLADKRAFAAWCMEHELATVPLLRVFEDGADVSGALADTPLPECDLFSKTAGGYGGRAAARWRWAGEGRWERAGRAYTGDELLAELAAGSRDGPQILQRAVLNHPTLRAIGGRALATLRVMTIQPPGETPRLLRSVFRIGAMGADMDNFTQGGMVCGVDIQAGRLMAAVVQDETLRTHLHQAHPGTGVPIAGVEIPFWEEAIALTLRAHGALGEFPCVGWDVAILDDGPVLLEGNWNPGVLLSQLPLPTPLGDTDYVRCFNAHMQRHFAGRDWLELQRLSIWEPSGGTNRWQGMFRSAEHE